MIGKHSILQAKSIYGAGMTKQIIEAFDLQQIGFI